MWKPNLRIAQMLHAFPEDATRWYVAKCVSFLHSHDILKIFAKLTRMVKLVDFDVTVK